jgi:hypothetical protein
MKRMYEHGRLPLSKMREIDQLRAEAAHEARRLHIGAKRATRRNK